MLQYNVALFYRRLFNLARAILAIMTKKELQVKLGKHIVKLREAKGLSQADLARLCERERSWMAYIETGESNATFWTLYIIAQALEVKLSELTDVD